MINNYTRLIDNLQYLKLYEISEKLNSFDFKNNKDFIDQLLELTDCEVDVKSKRAKKIMIKTACFPHQKRLDDFDFSFQEDLDENKIKELATLDFIDKKENIVFLGNSGVGKTHLSTSIGIVAAENRMSTYFIKCHDLILNLRKAKLEHKLDEVIKKYNRYSLLIIDELGYLPIDAEDAKLFFQLIDKRYETKSTIFTTNISFNKWDTIFKDPIIASAIIDRILHHCHVVSIIGSSYRTRNLIE